MSKNTNSNNTKIDECLDGILIFMQQKLVEQGAVLHLSWFDFSPSEVMHYLNAPPETTQDSEALTELKSRLEPKYHKYIPDALNKAKTHKYIQGSDLKNTRLTESGSERAIAKRKFELDEYNNRWKKIGHYFLDKILVPMITSVITSVITYYYLGPK
jgi:hypothetical protein